MHSCITYIPGIYYEFEYFVANKINATYVADFFFFDYLNDTICHDVQQIRNYAAGINLLLMFVYKTDFPIFTKENPHRYIKNGLSIMQYRNVTGIGKGPGGVPKIANH